MPLSYTLLYIAAAYLGLVNLTAFVLFGIDKLKARRGRWRVSEAALLWTAVAGGSAGALLGMRVWRHKTKHLKFSYGVPAILAVHAALAVWIWLKWYS